MDRLVGRSEEACSVGEMRDIWLRGVLEDRLCGCGEPFLACPFWTDVGEQAFGAWNRPEARRLHAERMRFDRPWTVPLLLSAMTTPTMQHYLDALDRLYRAIADVSGAQVIVDSTKIPSYAFLLHRIAALDLRFVHLVRDSRGVVHSWRKLVERPDAAGAPDLMIRYSPATSSVRYDLYNATADLVRRTDMPYLRLRYEDLVADPAARLAGVLEFGGLPPDVGFLGDETATLGPSHTVDGNPMRLVEGPLRIKADEDWRTALAPGSRRLVTALTAPLLWRYGYAGGRVPTT